MVSQYMERKDIPECILNAFGYKGRSFRVELTTKCAMLNAYWDGGSRSSYVAVELATGRREAPKINLAPPQFGGPRSAPEFEIPPGVVIVEHSTFCGKDMGLTIHARPEDFRPLLPAKLELSREEHACLKATAELKSGYGGNKNYRQENSGLTPLEWKLAQSLLTEKGLLDKRGAVTTAGRNAHSQKRGY